jgi:hypothetical protein
VYTLTLPGVRACVHACMRVCMRDTLLQAFTSEACHKPFSVTCYVNIGRISKGYGFVVSKVLGIRIRKQEYYTLRHASALKLLSGRFLQTQFLR